MLHDPNDTDYFLKQVNEVIDQIPEGEYIVDDVNVLENLLIDFKRGKPDGIV